MGHRALEVADIFRDHGPAWREANRGHVSLGQLKVMSAIERCRTAGLGGHVMRCENDACAYTAIAYNSCRDRHCPKCQGAMARQWLAARAAELLPVTYFHVVFTLPTPIGDIAHQNKAVIYDLLFRASAETMLMIAADPKHLGASIGITAVLHTWGSAMTHHPHVHMIVPGGGISLDRSQWIIKRPFVEHVLAELGLDREEVSQVCAKPTRDDSPSALIPLRQDTSETKRWYLTSIRTLVTGLAILSAGAVSAKFFQQQSVIGELDTQLATTGAKAREVRAHIDRLERKQSSIVRIRTAKYATPGLNDLLEWTTTLLPSHSWLSEFQLSQPDDKMGEQQINISGFSEGAASLVGLFDASPYFNDATLTSPISLDPVEARERFSMQMRVRKPRSEKSSTP